MSTADQHTFWEDVRQRTRWGQYVTSVERGILHAAFSAAKQPAVALEIGSEGGYWTRLLVEKGWRVICTEVDERAIALSRERVPSATYIRVSPDDTTLPCAAGSVHLIVCFEVFPVIHSDWFFAEAARALAPGGLVAGVTHNRTSFRSVANRFLNSVDRKRKADLENKTLYRFGYREWRHQLAATGFQVVKEEGMCWLPFQRKSNFFLIPHLTRFEDMVGLRKVTEYSPWIAFVAQKYQVEDQ